MEKRVYVGFPVPLLGPTPLRLPVLSNGRGVVALEKPAVLLATAHPWYAHFPNIADALGSQIRQSKPELTRLGIPYAKAIYHLDAEIAGPVLFGTSPVSASRFRERFGSQEMDFTFRLVARQRIAGDRFDISLPVAPHGTHPQLIVSRSPHVLSRPSLQSHQTADSPLRVRIAGGCLQRGCGHRPVTCARIPARAQPLEVRAPIASLTAALARDALHQTPARVRVQGRALHLQEAGRLRGRQVLRLRIHLHGLII